MTETTEATGRDSLGGTTSPLLGPTRIGIGLLQGLGGGQGFPFRLAW